MIKEACDKCKTEIFLDGGEFDSASLYKDWGFNIGLARDKDEKMVKKTLIDLGYSVTSSITYDGRRVTRIGW